MIAPALMVQGTASGVGKAVGRVTVTDPDEGHILDEAVEDFDEDLMDILNTP